MASGNDSFDEQCALYNRNNKSGPIEIKNPYGGIPQNLLTNVIGLSILILFFLILRKSAWKVINKIVKKNDVEKWTHTFFSFTANVVTNTVERMTTDRTGTGGGQDAEGIEVKVDEVDYDGYRGAVGGVVPEDRKDGHKKEDEISNAVPEPNEDVRSSTRSRRKLVRQHTLTNAPTFWDWFKSIFTMTDADIEERCGNDALQYLRFQRHVLAYLCVVVVLSICIILPLNFQGTLQGDETSFEHTTLVNLAPNSEFLWAHVALAFFFLPLAILVMRRFSVGVEFQEIDLDLRKAIMIENIPRYLCHSDHLKQHFEEAYEAEGVKVNYIHFAYNVKKLLEVDSELEKASMGKAYTEDYLSDGNRPFWVHPVTCSRCCSCCCCCVDRVEGLEYYTELESKLREDFRKEKEAALNAPLGIAFVSFRSVNMAKVVYDSFRHSPWYRKSVLPKSANSSLLKVHKWKVTFAATPDDIYWENLSMESRFLLIKKLLINAVLFLILFFLTTPEYIISQTDFLVTTLGSEVFHLPPAIVDFLPTLTLWGVTALLPLLVAWSDRFLGHWTRSEENHNIMKKTFWFLLFMVVLLPTFGFTTADAIFKFVFVPNTNETYRWECVFLPDSGAFFVNYIITAALVGAGLELIRFPELFFYLVRTCLSRSVADTPSIRNAIKYEFRFGEHYARLMLIFCMTMMYSLSCPLITPFGALYFLTKYYVDRHNLLYAYKPSKINQRVHSTAISFVILSVVVLQFFTTVFILIRSGGLSHLTTMTKVMSGLFLVSLIVSSNQLWRETCKKISPIKYKEVTYIKDDVDTNDYIYLPKVLQGEKATGLEGSSGSPLLGRREVESSRRTSPSSGGPPGSPPRLDKKGHGAVGADYDAHSETDYGTFSD